MAFTARSAPARAAILTAARRRFALDGYENATVRAIAADAGIDPSMIIRYYGSKDGLFTAAVDVDLLMPDLSGVPADRLGETLVRHFLARWEGELSDELLTLLLRSAITNAAAAERLREIFGSQVVGAIEHAGADKAPVRAALISSNLLGIALARYILELPPIVGLDVDTLVRNVAPAIQRYLTGELV